MVTVLNEEYDLDVPAWVVDLQTFRRWVDRDDLPEKLRVGFLKGRVWLDMSREQLFLHAGVKNEFNVVLGAKAKAEKNGRYFRDGVLLSSAEAEFASNPDGVLVSFEALRNRVRLLEGKGGGHVEIEGAADMALEVVSRSSVRKDTVVLRQLYWEAGIREYWLVDARKEPLRFDILRHTAKGYVAIRKQEGWVKSAVFGKSFRLTQDRDPSGHPEFTLGVR